MGKSLWESVSTDGDIVGSGGAGTETTNEGFDVWLGRQLQQMFESVAAEPLPMELTALLRGHEMQTG